MRSLTMYSSFSNWLQKDCTWRQGHSKTMVMLTQAQGHCVCSINVKPPGVHAMLALNCCVRLDPQDFLLEGGVEFPVWA